MASATALSITGMCKALWVGLPEAVPLSRRAAASTAATSFWHLSEKAVKACTSLSVSSTFRLACNGNAQANGCAAAAGKAAWVASEALRRWLLEPRCNKKALDEAGKESASQTSLRFPSVEARACARVRAAFAVVAAARPPLPGRAACLSGGEEERWPQRGRTSRTTAPTNGRSSSDCKSSGRVEDENCAMPQWGCEVRLPESAT
mmetsp:Transcript_9975/g.31065  ORF Transcript_9975/g.31065 Transcript_9975/m.31065 type:complete len:205 (+) Transcript_9975:1217-1831(+)